MRKMVKTGKTLQLKKLPRKEKKKNTTQCTDRMDWNNKNEIKGTCPELKEVLRKHNLKVSGNKPELIQRLQNHFDECCMHIGNNDNTSIQSCNNGVNVEPMFRNDSNNDNITLQSSGNGVDSGNNDKHVIYINQKQYDRVMGRREIRRQYGIQMKHK